MKTVHSTTNALTKRKKNQPPSTKKYYLGDHYPGIYFTKREAHCMVLFLENLSLCETAARLGLSPRTVEFYNDLMKNKMACTSKQRLVEKVSQTDFVAQVPAIRASLNQ